jgi:hypothetical protein
MRAGCRTPAHGTSASDTRATKLDPTRTSYWSCELMTSLDADCSPDVAVFRSGLRYGCGAL